MEDKEKIAREICKKVKEAQLKDFQKRMPDNKQGVEIEINGVKYVAAIRRLTPQECAELQTMPHDYEFVTSETQQYKGLGNGWNIETIKHIFSFIPKDKLNNLKVLSLFDGISGGQTALRGIGANIKTYLASEIDKYAIANAMHNFPNTIQLGSVTDLDIDEIVEKYGVPDIVIGGSPCFAAGTKVLTIDGYKNIEDIEVGDLVLTHKNRYKPVLRIGNKVAQTYKFHAQGFLDVVCTDNHPFYARKKNFEHCKQENGRNSKRLVLGEPEWIEAEHLAGEYYVSNNIEKQESQNPLNITEEEAWVIGRYIADGYTRKDLRHDSHHNGSRAWQLILSVGDSKVEKFCSHIKELHYSCYKHSDRVHRVVFSNKRLVEIVEGQCGMGAKNKQFGEMIIRLPNNLLEIVLKSYLEGDGCVYGEKFRVTTISPMLCMTLQRVVSKLYQKHICVTKHIPEEYRNLCGRIVHQNQQYVIEFSDHRLPQERPKVIGDKIWYNVKSFILDHIRAVYNLEVKDDNSYTANNIIVHNCQSFSFSGKMKGMSTKSGEEIYTLDRYLELKSQGFQFEGQSYLFWEYMRILTELRKYNPDIYFFLENVKMLEKWERCLSHAIGVRGVHINSALVSAQNRRRIYWTNIRTKPSAGDSLFYDESDPFAWPPLEVDIPQPEDRGIVIKDILQEEADEKYYLKSETVSQLMSKTDKKKLTDYLLEPQVSVKELFEYICTSGEFNALTDEEKHELAKLSYQLEKQRLEDLYNESNKSV